VQKNYRVVIFHRGVNDMKRKLLDYKYSADAVGYGSNGLYGKFLPPLQ
jgi:hypothetical protein